MKLLMVTLVSAAFAVRVVTAGAANTPCVRTRQVLSTDAILLLKNVFFICLPLSHYSMFSTVPCMSCTAQCARIPAAV